MCNTVKTTTESWWTIWEMFLHLSCWLGFYTLFIPTWLCLTTLSGNQVWRHGLWNLAVYIFQYVQRSISWSTCLYEKKYLSLWWMPQKGCQQSLGYIYISIYLSIYLSLWFWCMFIHLFIHGLRVYLAFLCPWKIERKGPPIVVETKSIVGYLTMGNTCISIYTLLGKLFGNFWETSLVPFPNFS